MYDWITASYNIEDIPISRFTQKIVMQSEVKNYATGLKWYNGYLYNSKSGRKMGVSVTDKRIKINLCPNKYCLGNNAEEVSIKQFYDVLLEVEETLEMDIGNFKIEKLDVTHTAITDYKPLSYYPYLCNQNTATRWEMDTTLYYQYNVDKVVKLFYDKAKESNKSKTWGGKQQLPFHLEGKNLTRFEVRAQTHRAIRTLLGGHGRVGQLFMEENVEKLQKWWLHQYEAIPKKTELQYNFETNMGAKKVQDTLYHLGLNQLGRTKIEKLIESAYQQGALSPSQRTYVKQNIIGKFENEGYKSELIEELDSKFRQCKPKYE